MSKPKSKHASYLLLVFPLFLGCQPQPMELADAESRVTSVLDQRYPPPKEDEIPEVKRIVPQSIVAGNQPWIAKEQLPWERWYVQYLDGRKIGVSHVNVSGSSLDFETDQIVIKRRDVFQVIREEQPSRIVRELEAIEQIDGQPKTILETRQTSEESVLIERRLRDDPPTLTVVKAAGATVPSVRWEPGTWGVLGIQAMLMRQPPAPGELLSGTIFLPEQNRIVSVEMRAGPPDITTLLGGRTERLTPVDIVLRTDAAGLHSRSWINDSGEILKTISLSGPNMSTFGATREMAERAEAEFTYAATRERLTPYSGGSPPREASKAVYSVKLKEGVERIELISQIAQQGNQNVVMNSAISAQVHVFLLEPGAESPVELAEAANPTAEDREASTFISSDDASVLAMATEILGETVTPREQALRLTRGVYEAVELSPLRKEIVSAGSTARTRNSDAVGHAVLLAALLRAQEIPARVAAGLLIDAQQPTHMHFHTWTEAWLDDRWQPLDATVGQAPGVDRIKILATSLAGENPYQTMLPVLDLLDKIEVRLQSPEPSGSSN